MKTDEKLTEQISETKDHFSPDRNHWCIVKYFNHAPLYYVGYFGKNDSGAGDKELLPAFTLDFNKALKMHSRIAADGLLKELNRHSEQAVAECKVKDHKWM